MDDQAVALLEVLHRPVHDDDLFLEVQPEKGDHIRFVVKAEQKSVVIGHRDILGEISRYRKREELFKRAVFFASPESTDGIVACIRTVDIPVIVRYLDGIGCRVSGMIIIYR